MTKFRRIPNWLGGVVFVAGGTLIVLAGFTGRLARLEVLRVILAGVLVFALFIAGLMAFLLLAGLIGGGWAM